MLLIGGTTDFDTNITALKSLGNEWSQSIPYSTRLGHLRGTLVGGLNGTNFLTTSTVHNDGVKDTLKGQAGNDWFWSTIPDSTDLAAGESVN